MNVNSEHEFAAGAIPQSAIWREDRGGGRVGEGETRSLLRADASEGILTVSFVPDKILGALVIQQLQDQLAAVLEETTAETVLLDFHGVKSLSTSAFGMLIWAYKKCRVCKKELKLCNLAPGLREILKVIGLDKMFDIHADVDAALRASLKKRRFF
jgi:anti-anti-sigma factor